jgi:anaerobic magnesium-protoporphyrin IX monomethyl ester cyclase
MKPKIVLYNPMSSPTRKRILPMSLLALGAVLEGRYDYLIVDGNVVDDPLAALRSAVREGANLLAVTVMPGPQLSEAFPHCLALKREFPGLTIVWGGYFPTLHTAPCLKSAVVDFVIRGHGESVLLKLLANLEQDRESIDLPGLAYRIDGAIKENSLPPIPHPDELPPFPYHKLEMPQYVRSTFLGSRTLPHHSSYGCPFLCNFCGVVNMVNGRWLAQSAAKVAQTVEHYVRHWQVNAVEFHDNNFFTHEARAEEFSRRVAHFGVTWWGEGRIDTLLKYSEATWRSMRDSGLKAIFLGAESSSSQTLRRMDKGGTLTPEKTLEIAELTRRFRVVPELSFIVGNPPDPEADAYATLDFIRRVKKANPASEIIIYMYTPVPLNGELYDSALADGFAFPATLEEWIGTDWTNFSTRRHARTPWLPEKLRREVRNFERVLNAYYPTSTDLKLTRSRRALLKGLSAWRYHGRIYRLPLELRVLQKLFHYQRPETTGF